MVYNCVRTLFRERLSSPLVLSGVVIYFIGVLIKSVSSGGRDFIELQIAENKIDKMFQKMQTLQLKKKFLYNKLDLSLKSANELDDQISMLKIELSNFPDILHVDIFKIAKNIARGWGIFNEDDIADMYVFSKDSVRRDKNVIIGFKTMRAKRLWLSCYKKEALSKGLKSLKGFRGMPASYQSQDGRLLHFNVQMLDHVSRYKAFLMKVCLGKARTINKLDRYRFWVNNSQIYGVCKNAGGVTGWKVKSFMIHCFDDISREIT